jgi:hypothetical protein
MPVRPCARRALDAVAKDGLMLTLLGAPPRLRSQSLLRHISSVRTFTIGSGTVWDPHGN